MRKMERVQYCDTTAVPEIRPWEGSASERQLGETVRVGGTRQEHLPSDMKGSILNVPFHGP